MIKKIMLILTAAVGLTMTAHAELGDNYAQSCKRFNGSRGTVSTDWIYYSHWHENQVDYWCQFRNNQCVAIGYEASGGQSIIDSEVWRLLLVNSKGITWNEYAFDSTSGTHSYVSEDHLMYATLSQKKQRLLVAYKTWFDRHHGWNTADGTENGAAANNNEQPPVQEAAI